MAAKKKSTKSIAKKKVSSPVKKDVKLILKGNESSEPPVKKAAKKKSSTKNVSPVKPEKILIYEEPKFQKPLQQVDQDIIKILTKNPWEAYIFWNIQSDTFQKCLQFFQSPSESIQIEINLEYMDDHGEKKSRIIPIHPLSNNYYCKFETHVQNLKATIFVNQNERRLLLFDSAQVNLPSDRASQVLDENWINQEWVDSGLLTKDANGRILLQSKPTENNTDAYERTSQSLGSSGNTSSRALGS